MTLRLHSPDPTDPTDPAGVPAPGSAASMPRARSESAPGSTPGSTPASSTTPPAAASSRRLNLLLTYGGWREHAFADQLPLILDRFGIRCIRAESGDEASDVIRCERVHIAVIDLSIPMHPTRAASASHHPPASRHVPAGPRVLQLLRRLEAPPPTIVVRPRPADPTEGARMLTDALRDGAFTVLDDPVPIESMLQALERVVRRHYRDHWTAA